MNFEELAFKHSVTYDSDKLIVIPLFNEGAIYIGGDNAAGKSLPFNILHNVIFGYTPQASKGKRKLIANDDYYAHVKFSNIKSEYQIKQFFNSKDVHYRQDPWNGNGYDVIKDGESLKISGGIPECEKRIASIIPFSQKEFCSFHYLTQDNFHVLVYGKGSDRLSFLSEVFGLDIYDKIRAKIKEKLDNIDLELLSVVKASDDLKQLFIKINKYPILEVLDRRFHICSEYLNNSLKEKSELYTQKSDIENKISVLNRIEELKNTISKYGETRLVEEISENIKNACSKRNKNNDDIKDWKRKKELLITYKEVSKFVNIDINVLSNNLNKFIEKKGKSKFVNDQLSKKEILIKEIEKASLMLNYPKDKVESLFTKKRDTLIKLKSLLEVCENNLNDNESLNSDGGKCSRCGSTLDSKHIKYEIDNLKKERCVLKRKIDNLNIEVTQLNEQLKILNRIIYNKKLVDSIKYNNSDKIDIVELDEKILKLKDIIDKADLANKIKSEIVNYKHVNENTYKKSISNLIIVDNEIALLDKELKKVNEKNILLKELDKIPKINISKNNLVDYLNTINNRILVLEECIPLIAEDKSEADTKKLIVSDYLEQIENKKNLANKLDNLNLKRKIIKACYRAYSPSCLKKREIVSISDTIAEKLNIFVPLIFDGEDIFFTTDPSEGSIDILFKRGNQPLRDIRFLNGGYKKRFLIALIPTLAGMVSVSKKSNLIILDEIEANVDEKGRESIGNFLIPYLKKKFNTVIVISPSHYSDNKIKSSIPLDHFDKIFVVEYKNGLSSIKRLS